MSSLKNKSGDFKSRAGEPVYEANESTNASLYQADVTVKGCPKIKRIIDIKNSQALIQMTNGMTRFIHTSFLVEYSELIKRYHAERKAELEGADVVLETEKHSLADAVAKLVEMRKAGL